MLRLALLAQLLDLVTYLVMVKDYGVTTEGNPLVLAVGPAVAIAAKVSLLALLVWAPLGRYRTFVLALAIAVGFVGFLRNATITGMPF